jgi:hypothetical protein
MIGGGNGKTAPIFNEMGIGQRQVVGALMCQATGKQNRVDIGGFRVAGGKYKCYTSNGIKSLF